MTHASPTSLLMVGESHSLPFKGLSFSAPGGESFTCRTLFFIKLLAQQYSNGDLWNLELINGLVTEGVLDKQGRPAFRAQTPAISPPLVFFAGDMDLHQILVKMGNKFDFSLPDDPGYDTDGKKQRLAYTVIEQQIATFLAPFLRVMEQFRAGRFDRLMIHALPPRTPDNKAAARWTNGIEIDAPIRAKMTVATNRQLRGFCDKSGIPFIDPWPALTQDGYLKPDYELDGVHVNHAAALVSLERIVGVLLQREAA